MQEHDKQGAREANYPELEKAGATARAAISALSNWQRSTNVAFGPATSITWISGPFTTRVSGKVLVCGFLSGTDATVDEVVTGQLIRDPTAATGAPGGSAQGGTPITTNASAAGFQLVAFWIDSVAIGSTHTWGINAVAAHAISVPTAGAVMLLVELPG
jgi:hypothetical protein